MDNSYKNLIFHYEQGSCFLHITNYSSISWNHWNDRYFGRFHLPKCRLKFSHIPQSLIHEGLKEDHHHLSLLCHLEEDIGHVLAKNMHTRWWWYFCIIWSSIMNGQWLTPMKKLLLILCQSSKRDFNWKFKKKIGEKGTNNLVTWLLFHNFKIKREQIDLSHQIFHQFLIQTFIVEWIFSFLYCKSNAYILVFFFDIYKCINISKSNERENENLFWYIWCTISWVIIKVKSWHDICLHLSLGK